MKIPGIVVTKEHGSWAVLLVPLLIGAGVARQFSPSELFLVIVALCVFMIYVPLHTLLRDRFVRPQGEARVFQSKFWVLVFGGLATLAGALLLSQGFSRLLPLGIAGFAFFIANFLLVRYSQKSVWSDLAAVAGLTTGGPAINYVATGQLGSTTWSVWILSFLFFGSSVFYVHMKMVASGTRNAEFTVAEKISVGRFNVLYHILMIALILTLASQHFTSRFAVVAFIPITVHAVVGTVRLSSRVHYRALGYALLAQSLVFSFLLILIESR